MTTDTDALIERIARAIHLDDLAAGEADPWGADEYLMAWYRRNATAVLPIVEAAVCKAQAEALREAAGDIVWSAETLPHMTLHDATRGLVRRADRIETGDSDERR